MFDIITEKTKQHREIILYTAFGVCTTAINFGVYALCTSASIPTAPSVIIAWFVSVMCAYIFSRTVVFHSTKPITPKNVAKEFAAFALLRVISGGSDLAIMLIFVDMMGLNRYMIKLASSTAVAIINYIVSKLIFKK